MPGIDFASAHLYVDQWLCTERGSTRDGQLGFLVRAPVGSGGAGAERDCTDPRRRRQTDYVAAHLQAAEEELAMPFVLEEFGAKRADRLAVFGAVFEAFRAQWARGRASGGILFWELFNSAYRFDRYGGGYGLFVPPAPGDGDGAAVLAAVAGAAAAAAGANAARPAGPQACAWSPPPPGLGGGGCGALAPALRLGAMPWGCLPGVRPRCGGLGFI